MTDQVRQFTDWYGDGTDGSCPTPAQWGRILALPAENPVTLINFFKLNATAAYAPDSAPTDAGISGQAAFDRYASVSIPTMERIGGSFLHVGPFAGAFLGEEEDWDVVAIGAYPNLDSLIALYADEGYRAVFPHRSAACARQKVLIAVS